MSEIQQILYIVILNNKGKSKAVETHSMFRKRKEKSFHTKTKENLLANL